MASHTDTDFISHPFRQRACRGYISIDEGRAETKAAHELSRQDKAQRKK